MSALVFMDTETTGLSLTDDIWEFAGIRREEDGTEKTLHLFIRHNMFKCKRLPDSFKADHLARYVHMDAVLPRTAAAQIREFMGDKAHIVGAVPNFDTERIALLLSDFDMRPDWHYHLIDVENLAVGFLARAGTKVSLPWDSDELSTKLGIEPPNDARHTAMGDAQWAMAIYDRVTWS
jgi:DNA polymerase III alpha subunit (gram-positive type)